MYGKVTGEDKLGQQVQLKAYYDLYVFIPFEVEMWFL